MPTTLKRPEVSYPGVYIQEVPSGVRTITGVSTSITAFIGQTGPFPAPSPSAPPPPPDVEGATTVTSLADFEEIFGGLKADFPLTYAVNDFFLNGGSTAIIVRLKPSAGTALSVADYQRGKTLLDDVDLFNILCIPPDAHGGDTAPQVWEEAAAYCRKRRAFLLIDPPPAWTQSGKPARNLISKPAERLDDVKVSGPNAQNAAVFFPRLIEQDPLRDGRPGTFVPCGALAGLFARTDTARGVWKAPAGLDATLRGVLKLEASLTDPENGQLNPVGINCLRAFPAAGKVSWGARTLRGADRLTDEYKYIPVRRTALFIEESLYRGTQFAVFEPNDEPLWAQLRQAAGAFMQDLFRQGAFQGRSPREAYLVKCDKETNTQFDINLGIVNLLVGFAPLKPAEFVIIKIRQLTGDITT
jgi:Bacteriophage tail sheath protein